jgi:multidrug transporter EmrE-like cation transporter
LSTLIMSIGAALSFAIGGIFMKLSASFAQPLSSFLVYVCFAVGATLQILAIGKTELGATYIAILGLEAVATLLFSIWLFSEQQSLAKLIGLGLIIAGVVLLRGHE